MTPIILNVMHKTLANRETVAADSPTRKRNAVKLKYLLESSLDLNLEISFNAEALT